jgi:hypothetical protein
VTLSIMTLIYRLLNFDIIIPLFGIHNAKVVYNNVIYSNKLIGGQTKFHYSYQNKAGEIILGFYD